MQLLDGINGLFELGGGALCWLNVRQLLRDRRVSGIYWPVQAFFALWGWWNLYYYPALGQWVSFAGGVVLVLGNTLWVVMALRCGRAPRRRRAQEAAAGSVRGHRRPLND
jgi:hypothetical protein